MFGQNKVTKPRYDPEGRLKVVGIWPTIQGEGPLAGLPAIFIRLAGCNLKCWFCDTDFESNAKEYTVDEIMERIQELDTLGTYNIVVLTGGEPLAQQITPLCKRLHDSLYTVQIETAGTVWPEGLEAAEPMIVCSPKTAQVHRRVEQGCNDWKYILRAGASDPADGLPIASTQQRGKSAKLFRPALSHIWVQPMDEYLKDNITRDEEAYRQNVEHTVKVAMRFGYRVSYQLHKVLNVE